MYAPGNKLPEYVYLFFHLLLLWQSYRTVHVACAEYVHAFFLHLNQYLPGSQFASADIIAAVILNNLKLQSEQTFILNETAGSTFNGIYSFMRSS